MNILKYFNLLLNLFVNNKELINIKYDLETGLYYTNENETFIDLELGLVKHNT